VTFRHCGESVDASRWPNLAAYVKRIHERPSFKAMLDEESPLVERLRAA
jgi:glutathione S-transferase